MALSLAHVSYDCRDAAALAAFWSAALAREVDDGATAEFASIGFAAPDDEGPTWLFARVPEGKTAKNRVHVDFDAAEREAEVARLVALGARVVAEHEEFDTRWTVLTDPERNEFCVAQAG